MGAQRNAAARAAAVPEPSGRGKKAAMCFGGADAGGLLPGRRGTGAVSGGTAGAFGAGSRGVPSGRRAANGARAGLGRVGPQRPRVGRDGAGRARAGRRGAGGIRRLSGADAGRARPGAAVYGGRAGYSRGRRAYCRGGGGRRPRTDGKRSELRGLCRVTGHRWEGRQRRGRKSPFSLYKEAFFAGARALSIQS